MKTRFRIHFRSSLSGCRLTFRMPNNTGTTIAYLSTAIDTGGRFVANSLPTGQASPQKEHGEEELRINDPVPSFDSHRHRLGLQALQIGVALLAQDHAGRVSG